MSSAAQAASGLRILLADGHAAVRQSLRTLLEEYPQWRVVAEASDGREAVRRAEETVPRYRIDVADNLRARAIYTQVVVLKKVCVTVIAVFTFASMLMVFDSVRQFGASILASAGVAGIVVGFAAQRRIATLLAGFQIALTQPIRVDDVVIVEGGAPGHRRQGTHARGARAGQRRERVVVVGSAV